ncbi:MAG TPA: S8 family serine peptidase [Candidatus Sumerlaeota bacterium]|nr:MAG: Minor extracellular protease vpr precursor [candidate division BRC1 bacterium ADurb.Bin183]HOE62567.1 S8 family serine peptidase [Candidatus Sumerlaeota bacterium]HRR30839.1 S8 family serine peptidase [Candidatus Sumerlaeia bacterium]HON49327.1 S8 family serine peptidase [Candidatus Sumerlaeota bacterium]HOR64925.1 S8 family serine peptidase [Candidatus Sumerlaeota bacterium]
MIKSLLRIVVILFCFSIFLNPARAEEGSDAKPLVMVYVKLKGPSAGRVFLRSAEKPERERLAAAHKRLAEIDRQQSALKAHLIEHGAKEVFRFRQTANAIQILAPADKIAEISALPEVERVESVPKYTLDTSTSVPFIGAPKIWGNPTKLDGSGIRIGIIDTGIDYTHANFGGSGDPEDFAGNDPKIIEPGSFPTQKVVGGWDFVGNDYDADSSNPDSYTPVPDPDPLDCNSHGSHVAGIAAGIGVTADGKAYTGDYNKELNFNNFYIGPGVAPRATLYALKVFGCSGTTKAVAPALEWAADPNGDGNTKDRLDVLNLSLGSSFGNWTVFEAEIIETLSDLGTIIVGSSGNSGNTFYITGGVGSAPQSISVANSIDNGITQQALEILEPASIAGLYLAPEGGLTLPLMQSGAVSGKVVYIQPADGCSTPANAADIAGNIALMDRGICNFQTKILNAQNAGAKAAIVVNNNDSEPITMGGSSEGITIPGVMISKADGALIKEHLSEGVSALLDASKQFARPDLTDLVSDSSSRGPAWDHKLKPDIAAPGFDIFSTNVATGFRGASKSGTSMAAPHVAGAAALARQANPSLFAAGIKAILMNTAEPIHDAFGNAYPQSRVGAGRLRLDKLADTRMFAMADNYTGEVSLNFGFLNLAKKTETTQNVILRNFHNVALKCDVTIEQTVAENGIVIEPEVSSFTISPQSIKQISIKLSADPMLFDRTPDPTTGAQLGRSRHTLFECSGRIIFNNNLQPISLPYYAAVRAASDRRTENHAVALQMDAEETSVPIRLIGESAHPVPLISAFQLGAQSDNMEYADKNRNAADILAVGAASNYFSSKKIEETIIYFGVAIAGDRPNPCSEFGEILIWIDTNGDGKNDFLLQNIDYGTLSGQSATDTFLTVLINLKTGKATHGKPINWYEADVKDSALLNSNVFVMPVSAQDLELTDTASRFEYTVQSSALMKYYYEPIDETEKAAFDPMHPALETGRYGENGTPFFNGAAETILVQADKAALSKNPAAGKVMLLHHMNTSKARLEIVQIIPFVSTGNRTAWSLY